MQVNERVQSLGQPIEDIPVVQVPQPGFRQLRPGPWCGDRGPLAAAQRVRRDGGLGPVVLRLSSAGAVARYVDLRFCVVDVVHESAYWLMPGRAVRLQRFRWRVSSVTCGMMQRKPRWWQ